MEMKDKKQLEEEEDVVKHLLIEMESQAEDEEKSNSGKLSQMVFEITTPSFHL